jgi:hypothetical protein
LLREIGQGQSGVAVRGQHGSTEFLDDTATAANNDHRRELTVPWRQKQRPYEACASAGLSRGPRRHDPPLEQRGAVLLAAEGDVPRAEIEGALGRAEELVALVDGRSLSPRILELRGRLAAALGDKPGADRALREAPDLYREIGAIGHAGRLAREIVA